MNSKKPTLDYDTKRNIVGYFFLLPSLFFTVCFLIYPFLQSVGLSFTDWIGTGAPVHFTGLENYDYVINNDEYWRSLRVNIIFAISVTIIQTLLGFIFAYILFNIKGHWQDFFKTTLFLPVILPISIIAVMWRFFLSPYTGIINTTLHALGLDFLIHGWIGEKSTALGTLVFVNTWQYIGFTMVIFLIAMQNISPSVLEAAQVDGANESARFYHFIIPLTIRSTETNVILSLSGSMKAFALFYMLTGGGPGTHTKVVSMLILETAFSYFHYNRALAMAVILFLIITVMTLITRYIFNKLDHENETPGKKRRANK
ncbi:MAG: sugar ABC transporter permease [Lachnospiraceae bacterium]|nr:sugar ABC transporter permease [Lachnospiraceae bacterium]